MASGWTATILALRSFTRTSSTCSGLTPTRAARAEPVVSTRAAPAPRRPSRPAGAASAPPAARVAQEQVLDLVVGLLEPVGQLLDHAQRDLGIAADHGLEGLGVDDQQLRVLGAGGGRRARRVVEDGHLPEELALPEGGEELLHPPTCLEMSTRPAWTTYISFPGSPSRKSTVPRGNSRPNRWKSWSSRPWRSSVLSVPRKGRSRKRPAGAAAVTGVTLSLERPPCATRPRLRTSACARAPPARTALPVTAPPSAPGRGSGDFPSCESAFSA